MSEKSALPAQPYPAWLEDAVFYQIYPPSFFDSDGDGIGDIPGMCQKLDYLHWLGVNALWLNPCFASPFQDGGYDITDFYQVAPRYGTNADLERLFAEGRARGMHIFLDLVAGHTSWEHPWFKASARHARNPYSDWFIWTHRILASSEGLNAVMGLYERDGSYITSFFACQPALNYGFAHPEPGHPWQQPVDAPGPQAVRQEIKNIMRYWLEKGAAGFRVDMAGSLVKNDPGRRETARFWREIRAWLDVEFPEAALVSEWGHPAESLGAGFHMDFLLHFGQGGYNSLFRKNLSHIPGPERYTWSFFDRSGHGNICEFLDEYLPMQHEIQGKGLVCIPSGNHDMGIRLSEGRTAADLAVAWVFLLTMPGAPFIYYGDEIGMRTVHGLALPNAGFSTAEAPSLYLPLDPVPDRPTAAEQMADPASLLNQVRALIALRQAHPALQAGAAFKPLYAEAGRLPFVYERRSSDGERIVVALNPSAAEAAADLPGEPCQVETLYGTPAGLAAGAAGWRVRLPPISAGIYRIR